MSWITEDTLFEHGQGTVRAQLARHPLSAALGACSHQHPQACPPVLTVLRPLWAWGEHTELLGAGMPSRCPERSGQGLTPQQLVDGTCLSLSSLLKLFNHETE